MIAHRHLEQVFNDTLIESAGPRQDLDPSWAGTMEKLSMVALQKYRELIEHPGFSRASGNSRCSG